MPLFDPALEAVPQPSGSLTVHLGFRGDVTTEAKLIGGARDGGGCSVQGFAVRMDNVTPTDMEYRVFSAKDEWSDWVVCGAFAGTRGSGIPLRGFGVRLSGALARSYQCSYAGTFEGSDGVVVAKDGQDCMAPNGAALEAMHIVFCPSAAAVGQPDLSP